MPVLKFYDGAAWTEVSTVGPQGPVGTPGATGATGPMGATGLGGVEVYAQATPPVMTVDGIWADISNPGAPVTPVTTQTVLVPAAGWEDFGDVYGGMLVTRVGDIVTIDAMLKSTAGMTIPVMGLSICATVPAGFVPRRDVVATTLAGVSVGQEVHRLGVSPNGNVSIQNISGTVDLVLAAGGWVAFAVSYQGT